MKFNVDHAYLPVNLMRFRLLSTNMQFRCIQPPDPEKIMDLSTFHEPNEAAFVFDDSRELDNLIAMLQKFRDGCYNQMGEWKREGCR